MGRTPLPPGEAKELFNCMLHTPVIQRLKIMCFRRSVAQGKKFSEGKFVMNAILAAPLPKPPTQEQIDAYIALFPKKKAEILQLAAMSLPKGPPV